MSEAVIRRAAPADAAALAALGAQTFCDTFAHLYPPADLAAYLREAYSVEGTRARLADPAQAAWMLEVDGRPVGHALAGPCGLPHPEVTPACSELKRIYLLPQFQGAGLGTPLLRTALDWLEARKTTGALWIGVWSGNLGAQKLYARLGFEKVGEYGFKVGRTLDHEFIMRRG
jgi:GNAT superfamily N-acetyltransferase